MNIFIDGSCRGNPGPGGFAIVELNENNQVVFCHQEQVNLTTNNAMELSAALYALVKYGKKDFLIPTVYCDSMYTINTLTNWKKSWKNNGWRRPGNKPVENLQLIQNYDKIEEKGYKINLVYVKGHNNTLGNELADKLATGKVTEDEVMKKYGQFN